MSCCRVDLTGRYQSPYNRYLEISQMLRQRLEKTATSLSLFAKHNAIKQNPIVGALFEIVIGYLYTVEMNKLCEDQPAIEMKPDGAPPKNGCIVLFVAEECLDASLSSIRSLVKHALHVARKDLNSTVAKTTTRDFE
jgi:hypothetical protein